MPNLRDERGYSVGITVPKGRNCVSCVFSIFIGKETELACLVHKCIVGPGRNGCNSFIMYRSLKQAKEERKKWREK